MKNSLEQYNKNFSIFYDNFLTGIAESMALFYIEQLNLKEDTGTVLDLMCGTGTLLNIFTDIGWTGTGVDLSSEMLNIARKKMIVSGILKKMLQCIWIEIKNTN